MSVRPSMRCASPSACSGAMLIGAENQAELAAADGLVEAEPKSISTGLRSAMMTFSGFTSRWIVARVCAASASAISATTRTVSPVRTHGSHPLVQVRAFEIVGTT